MNQLTLYCHCFRQNLNRHSQANQKNLMCGAHGLDQERKKQLSASGFYFDDTQNNISHLNLWLGDLTGLYWIWKNTSDEYVGTNQYRRFYDDNALSNLQLDDNTLYISAPVGFGSMSAYDQMVMYHTEAGFNVLRIASMSNKVSIKPDMIDSIKKLPYLSSCNMFFAHRPLFNKLCEILFEIIFELYEGSKYALPWIQPNGQTRMLAFLAERMLNMIYLHKEYFLGNVQIQSINWNLR
jgi:hypothetical protein